MHEGTEGVGWGGWSPEDLDLSLKHGLSLVPSCGLDIIPLEPPPTHSRCQFRLHCKTGHRWVKASARGDKAQGRRWICPRNSTGHEAKGSEESRSVLGMCVATGQWQVSVPHS